MSRRRGLYGAAVPVLLCMVAGCSSDKRESRTALDEERRQSTASETELTPAARRMAEEERQRQIENEAPPRQSLTEPGEGAAATLDCPVDVSDTDVAVLSESTGISVVFKLRDSSDTASLDALRLRVRGLAERYRSERIAGEGAAAATSAPEAAAPEAASKMPPPASVPGSEPEGGGLEGTPPSVFPGDAMQSEEGGRFGQIAISVQDTDDGAKIIIASEDIATLDVLRARLAQDAQIMTQTGSCPW